MRRTCDDYVPVGYFIPCIPNGVPLTPGINDVAVDGINTYGRDFFNAFKGKEKNIKMKINTEGADLLATP